MVELFTFSCIAVSLRLLLGFSQSSIIFLFVFASVYSYTKSYYYSIIFSILSLQTPSLYDAFGWPALTVVSFLLLLLSIFLYKNLPIQYFFILFGVLFYGAIVSYYLLLPFLFLGLLLELDNSKRKSFVFKLAFWWIFGFLIGYIIAQFVTYILTGGGITVAAWRQPHYIRSLRDIFRNMKIVVGYAVGYFKPFLWGYWFKVVLLFAWIYSLGLYYFNKRNRNVVFWSVVISVLVGFSYYMIDIVLTIVISPRTIVNVWLSIFFGLFLPISLSKYGQIISLIFLSTFVLYLFTFNYNNTLWYKVVVNSELGYLEQTIFSKESIESDLPVIINANNDSMVGFVKSIEVANGLKHNSYIELLDNVLDFSSVVKSAGFQNIVSCSSDGPAFDCMDLSSDNLAGNCNNLKCSVLLDALEEGSVDYDSLSESDGLVVKMLYNKYLVISFTK